jgi:endonuclease YncB( thermonuclease family)
MTMRTIVRLPSSWLVLSGLIAASCARTEADADLPENRAKLNEGDMVTVVGVVKGDELRVQAEGRTARLRLVGVYSMDDTQTAKDPAAVEGLAATLLKSEIVGHVVKVRLATPPLDEHGRYLGALDAAGRDLSLSLLEGGRLVVYTEFPFDQESLYLKAEAEARGGRRGVWRRGDLSTTIKGLRRQWAEERAKRGAVAADDPVLAPEP